jgi:hypothetical protein
LEAPYTTIKLKNFDQPPRQAHPYANNMQFFILKNRGWPVSHPGNGCRAEYGIWLYNERPPRVGYMGVHGQAYPVVDGGR